MDKRHIISKIKGMRQMFIANRIQKRQEKKFVEESGQPLLTLRSQGCVLVVSGDANSGGWWYWVSGRQY